MKKGFIVAVALLVALGIGIALSKSGSPSKPITYSTTAVSSQWVTYTSEENGFTVKTPPTGWFLHQYKNHVSFSTSDSVGVSVGRWGKPMQTAMEELKFNVSGSRSVSSENIEVNGLAGKRMTYLQGFFDGAGTQNTEAIFLQRGSFTYVISWTLGRGRDKGSTSYEAILREMLGTFRFIEVKHSSQIRYTDATFGFSFEHPSDWQLFTGWFPPGVSIDCGPGTRISLYVLENTTADDYRLQQGSYVTRLDAPREHFAHRLLGRHCFWMEKENYLFEKDGRLYRLELDPVRPELQSIVDGVLNSLRL